MSTLLGSTPATPTAGVSNSLSSYPQNVQLPGSHLYTLAARATGSVAGSFTLSVALKKQRRSRLQ